MGIALKQKLVIALGLVLALISGWQIADEQYAFAGVAAVVFALLACGWLSPLPIDALVTGAGLACYLVGNRGFAQLNLPGVPLLPAEAMLALGCLLALWRTIRNRILPVRWDALNLLLLAWLAIGAFRLRFDFRDHGFDAVRDFAMLYYAVFFFLAQHWHDDPDARRWLEKCLTVGFVLCPPVFLAFTAQPDFFLANTRVLGIPLIYVKSDVAGGLMCAGIFWFLHRFTVTGRWGWLAAAGLNLIGVANSNSRAALVALGAGIMWLLLLRAWRYLKPLLGLAAAGLLILLAAAMLGDAPWTQSPVYRFYESIASIGDVSGTRAYAAADLSDKPDNNQFRLTWWRTVIEDTASNHPWLGLGFGYDLADEFRSEYYAEGSEEFNARSPHNFLITVFGRMGASGLLPLLAILTVIALRTWRTGRRVATGEKTGGDLGMWLGAWSILVAACFGVVLEGPMGAVVFWTLLGLAAAAQDRAEASDEAETVAHLPAAGEAAEVRPAL